MGLSARAPHLTDRIQPSLGRVSPGGWWSWVLNPGLYLKNKGNGSFPKRLGHPTPHRLPVAKEQRCPTSPLTLHLCDLVFQCPRHDAVAAAAFPLQRAPPHHGCSERQRWALLPKAVRPPSRTAAQHQTQPWPRGRLC